MKAWMIAALAVLVTTQAAPPVAGQDDAEGVTVGFSDPSRPGTVNVRLLSGRLTIRGTDRQDVLITSATRLNRREPEPAANGLRRLTSPAGFVVEESDNVMRISNVRPNASELTVEVPLRTNLMVNVTNGGLLTIERVEGDIEVDNLNGPIALTDVGGSVVAHANNGRIVATLTRVAANRAMAFTSLNGNVDVTLPASVNANLKLRSFQGDVYTDFDIQPAPQGGDATVTDTRKAGGRHRVQVDHTIYGTLNGGGPEFELRTLNGNVYLRRGR